MKRINSSIESLESRIAPAGLITIVNTKVATWTDVDGDKVTLRITRGELTAGLFTTDQTPTTGLLVTKLDLTGVTFAGSGVTVTAARDPLTGGDNTVNLGYLDSTGHGLGAVRINGDLGRIDAGDPNIVARTPKAIASLTVHSMGMLDGATLPALVTQTSEIVGKVGPVNVRGSVQGILFNVTGGTAGSIDSLTIGGSLIGTEDADSGRFSTSGRIGPIAIKGSILGGAGQHSGSIEAGGAIASLKLGGSLMGGRSDTPSTDGTGVVRTDQTIGAVTIGGSIHGGTQQDSGLLSAAGNATVLTIGGGIVGGSGGTSSGGIFIGGNVNAITVKGDVLGGAALQSGVIEVAGRAGTIALLGSLTGGEGDGSGRVVLGTDTSDTTGSVRVARNVTGGGGEGTGVVEVAGPLGSLRITGSLHGGAGEGSGSVSLDSTATSVTISGDIAGGAGVDSGRVNGEATIGALIINGSLLGGDVNGSGAIVTDALVRTLVISGSVLGGDLADTATADLVGSALIQVGQIGSIRIGGSIVVGEDLNATHELVNNAAIRVGKTVGALNVAGSIQGTADTAVVITARGLAGEIPNAKSDVAFGSISVGGSVRYAEILGGFNTTPDVTLASDNPDGQIGNVTVGGDWVASDLVSGARWNDNFGNGGDLRALGTNNPDIYARIASVSIKGQVIGTADDPTDRFGFIAQEIGSVRIGPTTSKVVLNQGERNDNDAAALRYNLAGTLDVRVFEFS